jgi:hypothetical protein
MTGYEPWPVERGFDTSGDDTHPPRPFSPSRVGSEAPRGYDHQISAGGEPTARYMIVRHNLWYMDPAGHVDVKTTLQGSVGFLTETSAAISMRIGRFDKPWWSFTPELADYIGARRAYWGSVQLAHSF